MSVAVPPADAARIERVEARAWLDAHAAAPPAAVAALGLRSAAHGGAALLAADHSDSLLHNRVIALGMAAAADAEALAAVAAHFPGGAAFAINLSPLAQPGDLAQQLAARGMRTFFHHVKWLRGPTPPPAATTRLRVTRVAPADAGRFAAASHADEEPHRDAQRSWAAAMVGRPGWHHVLAWRGDEAVAGAAVFIEDGAAWLGHARTREAFRRQGAQQALLAERIRIAAEAGATLLTTETAPDWPDLPRESLRNVARAGFRIAYERPSWIRVI